jgi:hypothetical protein
LALALAVLSAPLAGCGSADSAATASAFAQGGAAAADATGDSGPASLADTASNTLDSAAFDAAIDSGTPSDSSMAPDADPDAGPTASDIDADSSGSADTADTASADAAIDSSTTSDSSLAPVADADSSANADTTDSAATDAAIDSGIPSDSSLAPDADAETDTGPANADTDAASPPAPLVPPIEQPYANVKIQLSSALATVEGTLLIVAIEPGTSSMAGGPLQLGTPLWQGPMPLLPASLWVELPAGSWVLAAMVLAPGAKGPSAGGMVCSAGAPQVIAGAGAVQQVAIALVDTGKLSNINALCQGPPPPKVPPLLVEQSLVQTPPAQFGGAHFMNALVYADRLWVAGSQDGYVSFDFPAGAPISSGLANWTLHGGPMCNRVLRLNDTLFCTSRAAYLQILQLGANQSKKQLQQKWLSLANAVTEGLVLQQGLIYIAAHKAGLTALQPDPPYLQKELTSPPGLDEAWDVAAIGMDYLAVAQGSKGLAILQVGAGKQLAPQGVAQLKLPGIAAYLHAQGDLVAIGALGGGLHLVDVSLPSQPKLRASLASPSNVYGVTLMGTQVFAAAGLSVLAADVPGQAGVGPLRVRGSLSSKHFAFDVDSHLGGLLTAEFQSVRRIQFNPAAPLEVPVLIAPTNLASAVGAVGGTLTVELPLHNAGALPLKISKIEWFETNALAVAPQQFTGPWELAPGASLQLPLTVKKLAKGVLDHAFILSSDDPGQPQFAIKHVESTWLHVGDTLPELPLYQDAKGASLKVSNHFKGKVGVLLVAAQSCPVAFQALASASADLAPLLSAGQITALAINPWDLPEAPEVAGYDVPFPVVYSGLTTSDGHDWSQVLDVELGQPILNGPPMPIVYVVGKDGKIALARWGYHAAEVLGVLQKELAKP